MKYAVTLLLSLLPLLANALEPGEKLAPWTLLDQHDQAYSLDAGTHILLVARDMDGAKLVNAVANSVVPKITIIIGNSFGAGNYAMCGKAYDPRFIYAWPTARIAVMGGDQAAKTLLQIQVGSMKAKGRTVSAEEEQKLLNEIKGRYEKQTSAYYAAARLWVDDIINPRDTRNIISEAIHAANHNAEIHALKTGVFQV